MFQGKRKEQKRIKVGHDVQGKTKCKLKYRSLMKAVENLESVLQKGGK